jgi:hypothetical protein
MAGTFTVGGSSAGLSTGAKTIGPLTIVGAAVVGEILDVALAAGDNTIAVPPGAVAVLIEPPSNNAVALKVRTNLDSGDAGLPIAPADPFGPWSFRGLAVTSIIVNAASSMAGTVTELSFI